MSKVDSQMIREPISSKCLAAMETVDLNLSQNTQLIFLAGKS